jgi:hypothetical protein
MTRGARRAAAFGVRSYAAAALWVAPVSAQQPAPSDAPAPQTAGAPENTRPAILRVGLPTTDAFTFVTHGAAFRMSIPIEADSAGTFRLATSSLVGADGLIVPVTAWLENAAADTTRREMRLDRLGGASMVLTATLPAAGAYRGSFTLVTTRDRTARAYTVTWVRRDRPIAILGGGTIALNRAGGGVEIPFTVRDTSAAPVRLYAPSLDDLRRTGAGDTSFAVRHGTVAIRTRGEAASVENMLLLPNQARSLEMEVEDALDGPGTYSGTIAISGPDFPAVTVPVKIYARRAWYFAALALLAGIVVAELIRCLRDVVRPRLEYKRDVTALIEACETIETRSSAVAPLEGEERTVVAAVYRRLQTMHDDARRASSAAGAKELEDLRLRVQRLGEWINLRRSIEAVEPPELRDDLRTRLEPIGAYLANDGVNEQGANDDVREKMRRLPDEIRRAQRDHVIARIDAFTADVKAERGAHPASDELLNRLEEDVQGRLAIARAHAGADRLTEARATFDEARRRYVDLLAAEVQLRLGQGRASWMKDDVWNDIRKRVQDQLAFVTSAGTPEEKLAAYQRTQALFLRESARTLEAAAKVQLNAAAPPAEAKFLSEAADQAAQTTVRVAMQDLQGAAARFAAAEQAWKDYGEARKAGGQSMGAVGTDQVASPPGVVPPSLPDHGAPIRVVRVPLDGSAVLRSRSQMVDTVISVVSALIATGLGIWLLWAPDMTWGTTGDVFAALFWGLGLQQAGNETFHGLVNLLDRVGGRTATP